MNPKETEYPTNKIAIGKKVKMLRNSYESTTDKPLTVEDVCAFTGMSRSSYFSVERGDKALTFEQAYLFCCLYSITFDELLTPSHE
jgi:transcriptional regulator with XRE-family HTH domain